MLKEKLGLTNEQSSPLFRIMWVWDIAEPSRRKFENNICAFHIGHGLVLSVAHNLRIEAKCFRSISEKLFQNEIMASIDPTLKPLFETSFNLDPSTDKRYLTNINQADMKSVIIELSRIKFDTRWITFYQKGLCKPYLVVQFKKNLFYNDPTLNNHFTGSTSFFEAPLNTYTFLIELELVEALYSQDISIYRIINTPDEIVGRLPLIEPDFSTLDEARENLYCLQSSPTSEAGKLLNVAKIDGFLEHFSIFNDPVGGNYTFEGIRYLITGYFRFGSSGAPYVFYESTSNKFKVNAIQSEACPIQLSIDNKRNGNFQYVNAIATPLSLAEDKLRAYMT